MQERRLLRAPLWRNDDEMKLVEAWAGNGFSDRTIEIYLGHLRRVELWCKNHGYRVRTLTALQTRELALSTPNNWSARRRLRSTLLAYWNVIGRRNAPVKAVPVPSKPQMRSKAMIEADANVLAMAARARGDLKGLAVLLGLYLALRRMEIASLRWDDFEDDFAWVTLVGKGDVSASLPVHPLLADALRALPRTSDWIFPGRYGGPVTYATIWTWVKQVCEEAELEPITTHVLRHTCLTAANDATGDLRAVQMLARHARPDTTAGYTRVNTKRVQRAVLSLDYQHLAQEATSA